MAASGLRNSQDSCPVFMSAQASNELLHASTDVQNQLSPTSRRDGLLRALLLLLSDNLTRVEFNKHCPVGFHFFERHSQAEIVEKEELKLEVVQFYKRQSTDLVPCQCRLSLTV